MTKWVNQTAGGTAGFSADPWQIFQYVGSSDYTFACPYAVSDLLDTGIGWQLDSTITNTYGYPITLNVGSAGANDYAFEVIVHSPVAGNFNHEIALIGRCWNHTSGSYQLQFGAGAVFRFNWGASGVLETRNNITSYDGGTPTIIVAGDNFSYNTFALTQDHDYKLRIEIQGSEIRSYVDDVLSKTNTWSGTTELDTLKMCHLEYHGSSASAGRFVPPVTSVIISDEFLAGGGNGGNDGSGGLLMSI